jgi:hypothetical protein
MACCGKSAVSVLAMSSAGDPKDAIKKISDELKEKANACGLGGADAFVDKLEGIKEQAQKGPGDVLDKIMEMFEDFKKQVDKAIEDPSSLAPGGPLAACATYYVSTVVQKLKAVASEADGLLQEIVELGKKLIEAFKSLAETMGKAMTGITGTVKGLTGLPDELTKIADQVKEPADIGNVDMGPLKKCLDMKELSAPLGELAGLKSVLGPVITSVKNGLEKLADFIGTLAENLRDAFTAPMPLCCIGAPPMLADMLQKVEILKGIEFSPFVEELGDTADTINNVDAAPLQALMEKFAEEAQENMDKLDKVVSGAKMAGSVPGMDL